VVLQRFISSAEDVMTTVVPRPVVTRPWPVRPQVKGSALARILRTTDAKQIGIMYMVTSFVFFFLGGLMALLMRAELARPGMQFLSPEQYNQLFTMHGTIMLLLFATPILFAFANVVVPLQIGAPAATCGLSAWRCPASARSSAAST
jgi:cytochrome c oxidase subunit I